MSDGPRKLSEDEVEKIKAGVARARIRYLEKRGELDDFREWSHRHSLMWGYPHPFHYWLNGDGSPQL